MLAPANLGIGDSVAAFEIEARVEAAHGTARER